VYEPLRCQCAYLSRYTKVCKRANQRKPTASNGLYTLLETFAFLQNEVIKRLEAWEANFDREISMKNSKTL
jgi:hypothetical protein